MSLLHNTVRRVAKRFGLQPVNDDEEWTVYWTDTSVLLERVMEMKRYQVVKDLSLLPRLSEVSRKRTFYFITENVNPHNITRRGCPPSLQNPHCCLVLLNFMMCSCLCRKSTTFQEWLRFVAKTSLLVTWTECSSSSQKITTVFLVHGACQPSMLTIHKLLSVREGEYPAPCNSYC